ncbi:hypothetical protein DERP_010580 [Dermatophagoides pteronyssinus]|uniref:Transmembrane protein 181-like n=1 Tax=Dermatophagoides pteronyssinus TaxID=6956 RepID=A0ABQ8JG99_DERPT|nr:hypothetical protein DERP_010580 [Dermatophagoides pteronyssinus]
MSFLYKARLQVNDMFSQFNRFIAPMYYHDRCERTLQMYVYVMHKREVLLSLSALLSAYILLLFIGLAGPNVDKINSVMAKEMIAESNIQENYTAQLLSYGPFMMITPALSTYSQQLSLHLTFSLKNEESSEAFHKEFDIMIDLDGVSSTNNKTLLSRGRLKSSLYCGGRKCEPIRVIRLIEIQYQHYRINLTFDRLQSVNEKYTIDDILFEFRSVNISFTTLSIWFRFFFLMVTFMVMCFYMHHLYRFSIIDWSLEQKWTAAQLLLLILSNNPFYPIQFLLGSEFPYLLEVWLHTSLQTLIMFFWLCFFHGIRQNNRSLSKFYGGKLIIVGTIWFTVIYTMSWSLSNQISNPILDEISVYNHSIFLQLLSVFFYIAFVLYFFYLIILVMAAFTELRLMPYFDVRLKLQTFLMLFVITISMLTILISTTSNPSTTNMISSIPFLQLLPFTHFSSSSATFLSIFSLVNIYICACAYYYRPSLNQSNECQIVRDNPTLSMINDSDEEVLYGSDTEELINIQANNHLSNDLLNCNQQNNIVSNLIDTRTDEESD